MTTGRINQVTIQHAAMRARKLPHCERHKVCIAREIHMWLTGCISRAIIYDACVDVPEV
jgi:hypothetical protein